jgi:hypothetical protein
MKTIAQAPVLPAVSRLPRLVIADGTIEAIKWLALALMVFDHANKYLYGLKLPLAYEAGRLVMPLFGFVLAYNLARPHAASAGVYRRTMQRLFVFGLAAAPMFYALVGIWPLSILFTLLLSTAIIALIDAPGRWRLMSAIALFVLGGAFVEFWWPAVLIVIAAWQYCRRPRFTWLIVWCLACAASGGLNAALSFASVSSPVNVSSSHWWGLASVPLIFLAARWSWSVPRIQMAFYFFYPAHLAVLLLLQRSGLTS